MNIAYACVQTELDACVNVWVYFGSTWGPLFWLFFDGNAVNGRPKSTKSRIQPYLKEKTLTLPLQNRSKLHNIYACCCVVGVSPSTPAETPKSSNNATNAFTRHAKILRHLRNHALRTLLYNKVVPTGPFLYPKRKRNLESPTTTCPPPPPTSPPLRPLGRL